jgi:hypothetical protein
LALARTLIGETPVRGVIVSLATGGWFSVGALTTTLAVAVAVAPWSSVTVTLAVHGPAA